MAGEGVKRLVCPLLSVGRKGPAGCLGPRCMWWVERRTRLGELGACAVPLASAPAPVDGTTTLTRSLEETR